MPIYHNHGIKHFLQHTGIASALKQQQTILCGHDRFSRNFLSSINACAIDLTVIPHFSNVLPVLYKMVLNLPPTHWKRVSKISMAYPEGGQIDYTSLTHSSLSMWAMSHYSKDYPDNPEVFTQLLSEFENNITTRISEFVTNCNLHVVRLQPGALRSMPSTVPQ
jgi:hypothetical protein